MSKVIQEEDVAALRDTFSIYLCFGSFDPLHVGHIAYLKATSRIKNDHIRHADGKPALLLVAVMGDGFTHRKKGFSFYTAKERATIVSTMQEVDKVIIWDDNTNTIDGLISTIKPNYLCVGLEFEKREYTYENVTTLYRLGSEVDKSHHDYVYNAAIALGTVMVEEEIAKLSADIDKDV